MTDRIAPTSRKYDPTPRDRALQSLQREHASGIRRCQKSNQKSSAFSDFAAREACTDECGPVKKKLNQVVDYPSAHAKLNHMVDLAERRLSHVFEALSDPGRRWIVTRLAQNPCTPSDLTRPLHMSLQGVTKHVAVLERAGIVRREKRGRQRILSLEGAALHAANVWIDHYRAFWENKLDALAAHVAGPGSSTPSARSAQSPSRKES